MINRHTFLKGTGVTSILIGFTISFIETANGTSPALYILLGILMIYLSKEGEEK